jgi:hypothetical protein
VKPIGNQGVLLDSNHTDNPSAGSPSATLVAYQVPETPTACHGSPGTRVISS